MGVDVHFSLGSEDGMISHFMSRPLGMFEAWAKEEERNYPGLLGQDIITLIHDVRERGIAALQATDSVRAACVDRMLFEFYGSFSLRVPGLLVEADTSLIPLRHYMAAEDILSQASISEEIITLWHYLDTGRPILRDPKIIPYTKKSHADSRLGYWTLSECLLLQQTLTPITTKYSLDSNAKQALNAALRAILKALTAQVGLLIDIG